MSRRTQEDLNALHEGREIYYDAVGQEALRRSGKSPQLKGIVHEVLFRDQQNCAANGLLSGNVTQLTKRPTARGVDLVTVDKNGHVAGRYQLKDCTSVSGIGKTLSQVRRGKYHSAKMLGTEETTRAFDAARKVGDKTMRSTGISSNRTGRIADNVGAQSRDAGTTWNNFKDIQSCAASNAAFSAAASCLSSAVSNYDRYKKGELSAGEYAAEVASDSATSAVRSAATTAAALTLKEGGKALGRSVGSESLKRLAGSNAATAAAFAVAEIGMDAVDLARGKISGGEFAKNAMGSAGSAAGGLGGAAGGAALGTMICPVVGTAIGGAIGGVVGGIGGRSILKSIGSLVFD